MLDRPTPQGLPLGIWKGQVQRALLRAGSDYVFTLRGKDQFGQPTGAPLSVVVHGLYHEDHRWTPSNVVDDGASNLNRYPTEAYILCQREITSGLVCGMVTNVAGKEYELIKSRDFEGLGLFCDLILQEMQSEELR